MKIAVRTVLLASALGLSLPAYAQVENETVTEQAGRLCGSPRLFAFVGEAASSREQVATYRKGGSALGRVGRVVAPAVAVVGSAIDSAV